MKAACCHCGDETGKAESRAWGCRRERARNRGQYQRRERGMACGGCSATDVVVVVLQQAGRRCCCSPVDAGVESLGLVTRTDTHLSTKYATPPARRKQPMGRTSSFNTRGSPPPLKPPSRVGFFPHTTQLPCCWSPPNTKPALRDLLRKLPACAPSFLHHHDHTPKPTSSLITSHHGGHNRFRAIAPKRWL
jgi:hypothetical protein